MSNNPSGPTNGPPVYEPPGYADALIEILDTIEANRRINLDAVRDLETKRDALKSILQTAIADAGLERVFDPATESMRSVSYADRRTKAMAIDVQSEPCGNSTKVRLSEELRGKVSEILGSKVGPSADRPAPPKVAESIDGGHDGEAIPEDNQWFADALRERSRVHVAEAFGGPPHGDQ